MKGTDTHCYPTVAYSAIKLHTYPVGLDFKGISPEELSPLFFGIVVPMPHPSSLGALPKMGSWGYPRGSKSLLFPLTNKYIIAPVI